MHNIFLSVARAVSFTNFAMQHSNTSYCRHFLSSLIAFSCGSLWFLFVKIVCFDFSNYMFSLGRLLLIYVCSRTIIAIDPQVSYRLTLIVSSCIIFWCMYTIWVNHEDNSWPRVLQYFYGIHSFPAPRVVALFSCLNLVTICCILYSLFCLLVFKLIFFPPVYVCPCMHVIFVLSLDS